MQFIDIHLDIQVNNQLTRYLVYTAIIDTIDSVSDWDWREEYEFDNNQYVGIYGSFLNGEYSAHGSDVTGALLGIAPYASITMVDMWDIAMPSDVWDFKMSWAIHLLNTWVDPDVISTSLSSSDEIGYDIEDRIDTFLSDGTSIMFASAGNTAQSQVRYPAEYDDVRGIGAIVSRGDGYTHDGTYYGVGDLTHFTNTGEIFIVSPGRYVNTIDGVTQDEYDDENAGTSFSTPIVAGGATLIIQAYKLKNGNSPIETTIDSLLRRTDPGGQNTDPDDLDFDNGYDNDFGYGILDIWEAIYDLTFWVKITSPTSGSVSGWFWFRASTGEGVTQVKFYIGSSLVSTDTSSPWEKHINSASYSDGAKVLKVIVYDDLGNSKQVTKTVMFSNGGGGCERFC